ncbi:diaminopimelate epimerase [Aggregatimonas sangjinii]|uniref:Diaminopimelate epimerase n=1 Tax=Aggregatimonas sangjinii TaxID=2583587 RepID=A0A5B7SSK7_9FLAO|nr:diaminopimelate epimerase [Aggregatimonas sangjinii]QCX00289.1 diaminopimelate epimerase [Aggregatimonas sangjinii]
MQLPFYKYQGTGNDFIMVDNREESFPVGDMEYISFLCDRRIGIGADGLILLENDSETDFKMVYFNSDGNQSSMCGNGGRCLVAFARYLGIIQNTTTFNAIDGMHAATITDDNRVKLQMRDVTDVKEKPDYTFLDTGSPHHVQLVDNLKMLDVAKEGAKLRYGMYGQQGSNINFVEPNGANIFKVRTYERGVEDETLSCGTGVTAVALAMHHTKRTDSNRVRLHAEGGELEVEFEVATNGYKNVFLIGPTKMVFKGEIVCKN